MARTNCSITVDGDSYSELKVLKSAAGYYVGRQYQGMPGTRQTDYVASEELGKKLLEQYLTFADSVRRDCFENTGIYEAEDFQF